MRVSSHELETQSLANSEQALLNFPALRAGSNLYYYNCLPKQKNRFHNPPFQTHSIPLSVKSIHPRIDSKKHYAFLKYKISQNKDSIEDNKSRTATW